MKYEDDIGCGTLGTLGTRSLQYLAGKRLLMNEVGAAVRPDPAPRAAACGTRSFTEMRVTRNSRREPTFPLPGRALRITPDDRDVTYSV